MSGAQDYIDAAAVAGTDKANWLSRFGFYLQRARNDFDTLNTAEAIMGARSDLERALALLDVADKGQPIGDIEAFTYDEATFWATAASAR